MSVEDLQHSPGLRQSVSGAARLQVAVIGGALVDRALALQRGLIFARGWPVGRFAAVMNTIEEVDGETWRGGKSGKRRLHNSYMEGLYSFKNSCTIKLSIAERHQALNCYFKCNCEIWKEHVALEMVIIKD